MTVTLLFKGLIIVLLLAIMLSLATGMFFLIKDKGQTRRAVTSLTVRISLSVALFILLFIGYTAGIIRPHGVLVPQIEKALPETTPLQNQPGN